MQIQSLNSIFFPDRPLLGERASRIKAAMSASDIISPTDDQLELESWTEWLRTQYPPVAPSYSDPNEVALWFKKHARAETGPFPLDVRRYWLNTVNDEVEPIHR